MEFVWLYNTVCVCLVVVYGCETWSLTLRDERRLRVFENGVLRRIFGPKRNEVTGEWRKLHNEEKNERGGHVARMGEREDVYRVFMGKPEVKIPFGRPSRRWEDNIKMDLQKVVCAVMV